MSRLPGHRPIRAAWGVVASCSARQQPAPRLAGPDERQRRGGPARPSDPATQRPDATPPGPGGLLRPRQNQFRNVLDLSGLWRFQLDPQEEGEAQGWAKPLPAPRMIPVLCSWNDLFDDARDYLGLAWCQTEVWSPSAWRGQRVFLRVGSASPS